MEISRDDIIKKMTKNKKGRIVYKKVFTRDFTLPWIQIWYKGEAKDPKPWNKQVNRSFPYIVYLRKNHTIESYYDMSGLNWSRNSALDEIRKNDGFISDVKTNVTKRLGPILKIIKKGVLKNKDELSKILDLFQEAYPWFLVMWEIGESEPEQIRDLNVEPILKLKGSTITLTDDLDNLIRKTIQTIYPSLTKYSDILAIDEIKTGNIPSLEILKKREEGFIYTDEKLFLTTQQNKVENTYQIKLEQVDTKNVTKLHGSSASMGQVKGKVRKVMSVKDLKNFKDGEILVSPMTMPDFAVVMKKASAIITDEGGITCHAAILAREFGIPCIVGTRIATQVLADGDIVEVDTEHEIVNILTKSN
jgi:phosphoenolpyruvate synthase/pyruvate phosphate dikinase